MPDTATASVGPMLLDQVRYANRGFWRTPIAAFFTIVFPLSFLIILCTIYGNEVIDPDQGVRLAQYTTPAFAVFGVCMACMVSLALAVAYARASGVLKRLHGTPLPPSMYIAGRLLAALWISMIATLIMVGVGVTFYGVQIIWANVPALVLTFLVGVACFCAIGLAIAALAPTPSAAQAVSNGGLIILAMISGVFGFAELPSWMEWIAKVFPLKHFVDPAAAGFNPYVDASVPAWGDLAVMALWGIAAAVVVSRTFRWEPAPDRGHAGRRASGRRIPDDAQPAVDGSAPGNHWAPAAPMSLTTPGRPGLPVLVGQQTRYAALQVLRDPMSMFFAIAFPVALVVLFSIMYGDEAEWGGLPLPQYLAAAFGIYGVATTAFVNLPGSIADQRAQLVLKRMRGTPLPPLAYLSGRALAAVVLGAVTVVLIFVVAVAFFPVTLPPSTWLATALVFVLAIITFAACGLALVALVDGPQAVIAVALCVLLPLSFISDIFISTPTLPTVLNAIGWAFPLRHAVHAAVAATSGAALDAAFWTDLGVLLLWTGIGLVLARRFFHWEPRSR